MSGEIRDYSTLADSNTATPPDGMPDLATAQTLQPTMRDMMARLRRLLTDISGELVSTGSNGAYVVQTSQSAVALASMWVIFRANHENPNAAPTLSVGGLAPHSITYADGGQVPPGAIKKDQIVECHYDLTNNRWNLMYVAASITDVVVDGTNLTLDGQVQGSIPVLNSQDEWVAAGPGTAGQFMMSRGPSSTPQMQDMPKGLPGMTLLACAIKASNVFVVKSGLKHSATYSRLAQGSYRLTVTPDLPTNAFLGICSGWASRYATAQIVNASTIDVSLISMTTNNNEDVEGLNVIYITVV